jgi:hypothetical protein
MIDGCLRQADGRSVADLERLRDGFLADLLDLVERYAVTPRIPSAESGGEAEPARPAEPVRTAVTAKPTAPAIR